jgi:hypothetical protein
MGRACSTHWEKRNACRILIGKPEERYYWKDTNWGESIILKWVSET